MILDDVKTHYRAHWGAPSRTASYRFSEHAVKVLKWDANKNPEQVNIYATMGASSHVVTGYENDHRLEVFVGLTPPVNNVARPLALLAMEAVGAGPEWADGHSV